MPKANINELVECYQNLTAFRQQVLRNLAFYATPIDYYRYGLLAAAEVAGTKNNSQVQKNVYQILREFSRQELAVETNRGYLINFGLLDYLVRQAVDLGECEQIRRTVVASRGHFYRGSSEYVGIVDFLEAFYRGHEEEAVQRFKPVQYVEIPFLLPFDSTRLAAKSPKLKSLYVRHLIHSVLSGSCLYSGGIPFDGLACSLKMLHSELIPYEDVGLRTIVLEWALASGDRKLLDRLDEVSGGKALDVSGCRALLDGDLELAANQLCKTTSKSATAKCLTAIGNLPSLYYILLKISGSCGPLTAEVARAVAWGSTRSDLRSSSFQILARAIEYREEPSPQRAQRLSELMCTSDPIDSLLSGYLRLWLQLELQPKESERLQQMLRAVAGLYRDAGCHYLATEAAYLAGTNPQIVGDQTFTSVATKLQPKPMWEQRLQSILDWVSVGSSSASAAETTEAKDRLIFEIYFNETHVHLDAFQQTRKNRSWSKGRKINLKRLADSVGSTEYSFLTEKDRAVIKSFRTKVEYGRWGTQEVVEIVPEEALRGLIGHPHVYRPNDREQPIEITEVQPRLIVETAGPHEILLRLDLAPTNDTVKFALRSPSKGRLLVTFFTDAIVKLNQRLNGSLKLPREASNRLTAILRPLSSVVMVHSEIDLGDERTGKDEGGCSTKAEVIEGQLTPFIHLFPTSGGYCLDVLVYPFGEEGPSFRPGEGGTKLFTSLGGKSLTANRNLTREKAVANQLLERCPHARSWLQSEWSAMMPTPLDTLEVLVELELAVRDEDCRVLWPQGKMLRLAGQVDSSNLQVRIKKDRDWFAASGSLHVDDALTVDMMRLIDLVSASPGRFIQLEDGRFLALTEQLRRQIAEFQGFGDRRKSGTMRFSAAHVGVFENLTGVKLKADTHWQKMLERMRSAQELDPKKPDGFLAELRDYQEDGYKWMVRLAAWGVGGCLADDMGLGKTIQALAMLMGRTTGPALVIAPTSIVFNWAAEIQRFAPTLHPRMVADEATGDELRDLQPNDVVLCSYGLLQHRTAMLQATEWNTLILDEAQAIKNTATQRSQAAKSLKSNFRMIMTGTPIENHLGELWNLLDFINPGLLGSAEAFQERFATPIERDQCRHSRTRLKKLVSPFLLRRTKAQVLTELPSRTEITLHVTLSPEEAAFYEALRQQAIKKLTDGGEDHATHLRILAEIMRLRRACCHPKLVVGNSNIECSKLKLFLDTVDELRVGGHKALVFSQFVDHLAILRQELDRKQITYQYLDGSTPAKQRKKCVEAFQAGEGDFFLISLKAGGAGLNLTAADYVLHMDPWWNPAVEDQASDRAHRMGQQRPVTIYRFITEGTIEQKIQQLHGSKRELADSLLEGADRSGKMSADDLLALLRG